MKENESKLNLAQIYPDPLIMIPTKYTDFIESKLNLENLTSEYIVFKVYNNNQKLYKATPSCSFIPPKDKTEIEVKRFQKGQKQEKPDRFLFKFYTVKKVINNNDEAKDAINSELYDKNSEQKIYVNILLEEKEPEIPIPYKHALKELNEKLRKQINNLNDEKKILEKKLINIKNQRSLHEEAKSAVQNPAKIKSNKNNFSRIIIIGIILIGLLFGANFANIFNWLFNKRSDVTIKVEENRRILKEEVKLTMNEEKKNDTGLNITNDINKTVTEKKDGDKS